MNSAEDVDHFKIINESLTGTRAVDEDAFSSVAVLAERLNKLQRNNSIFRDITFSPEVEELAACEMMTSLC